MQVPFQTVWPFCEISNHGLQLFGKVCWRACRNAIFLGYNVYVFGQFQTKYFCATPLRSLFNLRKYAAALQEICIFLPIFFKKANAFGTNYKYLKQIHLNYSTFITSTVNDHWLNQIGQNFHVNNWQTTEHAYFHLKFRKKVIFYI